MSDTYKGVTFDSFLVDAVKGTAEIMEPSIEVPRELALRRLYDAYRQSLNTGDYLDAAAEAVWANREVVLMVGRAKNARLN